MPAKGSGLPPEVRFWRKVDKAGPGGCWLYTGAIAANGYGSFWLHKGQSVLAHRYGYEVQNGPIPDGLSIDHLCRVRACVRGDHLEAVPIAVNILRSDGIPAINARKTECKRGHEFTEENTYVTKVGRNCKTCKLEWDRTHAAEINRKHVEYRARKKAERQAAA